MSYEIRIRSAAETETHVRGAIYLNGNDADVTLLDQLTPVSIKGDASLVSGIVQSASRETPVRVEVFVAEADDEPRMVMGARGRTILLGDEKREESPRRFIRTAK
jgi:hypothetical protein